MAFPESFVEDVRRQSDIVRLISEHMPLKKLGASWKGLCPFHNEKTPSFNVRSEPAVFHCFGCGAGGDIFKFLMLRERMSFPEAVEAVARRFGIPIPEHTRFEQGADRKEREEILALMEAAAEHFTQALWTASGARAREYLLGRGFQKTTLETIRAGAARDSWDDMLLAMRRRFSLQALLTAGLILERQKGDGHYDRFRNRAIFPILNESGKVVAFGARSLDGSEPKYLNSPETPVYQKGRTLYGLNWAKDAIRSAGRIVLMEGYLDVARAIENGVGEAVATCGTALTAGHARLLHRFAERVVLNFDQDEAGQKAARKSFDILVEEGLAASVVVLPPGHDPDTYLKAEGSEAYRKRLSEAPVYMEWLMGRAAGECDLRTPAGKAAYLQALLPALVLVESAVERAAWLQRIAERGSLDLRACEQELRKALQARGPVTVTPEAPRPKPPAQMLRAEEWLLLLVVRGADGVDDALGELADSDLDGLAAADVLRAARAIYLRGERVSPARLEAEVAGDDLRRLVTALGASDKPTGSVTAIECVAEIKRRPMEARLRAIQRELEAAKDEALDALLKEKLELRQRIASLTRVDAAGH
jgi:DNA primase